MNIKYISIVILCITILLQSVNTTTYIQASETDDAPIKPSLVAETAVVYDVGSQSVLYDKGMNKRMYPASITKLMTAYLAVTSLTPEDTYTFNDATFEGISSGSSSIGIRDNEILTVDQILHGLLLMSSNETANALAIKHSGSVPAFVEEMNATAADLGMINTHFNNPHGLYDSNHYTTAYDMALVTAEVIKNQYFLDIMKDTMYQIPETNKCEEIRYLAQQHKMLNNKKDMTIYREDVIAGKVGYTTQSMHTLVTVAQNDNRTLIIVVMKDDYKNVYIDTEKLIEYGYAVPLPKVVEEVEVIETEDTAATLELTNTEPTLTQSLDDVNEPENLSVFGVLIRILLFLFFSLLLALIAYIIYVQETNRRRRLKYMRKKFKNLR